MYLAASLNGPVNEGGSLVKVMYSFSGPTSVHGHGTILFSTYQLLQGWL